MAREAEPSDRAKVGLRRRRRLTFPVVLLLMLVAAGASYVFLARPWEPKPILVATEQINLGPVSRVLAVNGRVAAKHSVAVRSSVPGQVLEVLAVEGDFVTAGQVIAKLDGTQSRAQVAQAQAALDGGMISLRQAQLNADRAQALGENVPRKTMQDADLSLTAAKHEVERLKGVLDQAQSQLAQNDVRAPLSGAVLARSVDPGQVVDTQSTLFTVADTTQLVVQTDVDELYSAQIHTGLRAVLLPAGASATFGGKVTFAAPVVDTTTGGRKIEISFDSSTSLPVGLTVTANIIVDEQPSAISVPRGAVVIVDGGSAVYLLQNGKVVRRSVTVVDWPATRVLVKTGLSAGEQLIIDPTGLSGGETVQLRAE